MLTFNLGNSTSKLKECLYCLRIVAAYAVSLYRGLLACVHSSAGTAKLGRKRDADTLRSMKRQRFEEADSEELSSDDSFEAGPAVGEDWLLIDSFTQEMI